MEELMELVKEAEALDRHIGALAGTHPAPRPKPVKELPPRTRALAQRLRTAVDDMNRRWQAEQAARLKAEQRVRELEARLADVARS